MLRRTANATAQLEAERAQSIADAAALSRVLEVASSAADPRDVARVALDVMRSAFGWTFAMGWVLDPETNTLRLELDDGPAPRAFVEHARTLALGRGEGLAGSVWAIDDMVVINDLRVGAPGIDVSRVEASGLLSGVAMPVHSRGKVVGVMQFLNAEVGTPSDARLAVMRAAGMLVSAQSDRAAEAVVAAEHAKDVDALTTVVHAVANARSVEDALRTALETVRTAFDWDYGSYWPSTTRVTRSSSPRSRAT